MTCSHDDFEATAALNFEPWDRDGARITMQELFRSANDGNFIAAHLAQEMMFDTKDEMIERLSRLDPEKLTGLWETIQGTSDWFHGLAEMTKSASARMLVAIACIAQQQEEREAA